VGGVTGNSQPETVPRQAAEAAFRNLVVTVMIDGKVEPSEKAWVHYARRLLGLEVSTANAIIKEMATKPLRIQVPTHAKEKQLCFDLMVAACKADGKVQDQEMALLKSLGPRFGYTEAEIEEKIKTVTMQSIEKEMGIEEKAPAPHEEPEPAPVAVEGADGHAGAAAQTPEPERTRPEGPHATQLALKQARLRLETVLSHLAEAGVDRRALAALEEIKVKTADTEKALDAAAANPKLASLAGELIKALGDTATSLKPHIDSPAGARLLRQQQREVLDILNELARFARKANGK